MGREEGDLADERMPATLRLPRGLRRADQDVANVELAVLIAPQSFYRLFTFGPADGLTEGQHVGRPIFLAVAPVEIPHLVIANERDRDPRVSGKRVRLDRGADGAPDRGKIAWRCAADGESQRPEASGGGVAAGGTRVMRSSGYGIRSW